MPESVSCVAMAEEVFGDFKEQMEQWRTSTAAFIAVMRNDLDHVRRECARMQLQAETRLEALTVRVNEGFSVRVYKLENDILSQTMALKHLEERMARQEEQARTNRTWARNVAATLLCALVVGFVGQYLTGTTKVTTLQQELQQLTQQIRELKRQGTGPP